MVVQITMLDVGKLNVADDNLRGELGDLSELAESVKSLGVLEPLLVREGGDHLVVAGARRLAAAKLAGLKQVPALVRPFTEEERLEVMIVENLLREDITPLEEAEGYRRLVELGQTQRDIAARVGCGQSHISKRLALLELPKEAIKAVGSGAMNLETAQHLAKLKGEPEAVAKIVKAALNVGSPELVGRQVETKVRENLEAKENAKKVAVVAEKLKKDGEKDVVVLKTEGYYPEPPKGYKLVLASSYREADIEMAPGTHRKMACHAVGINPRSCETVELCSDPSKHQTLGQKRQASKDKEKAASEKAAAQRAAENQKRHDFLRGLCKGTVDKALLLDLVHVSLFMGDTWGWQDVALKFVNLSEKEAKEAKLMENEPLALLDWYASKSQVNRLRVTFAIAVARMESHYRLSTPYLRLLIAHGYKPNPKEQASLDDEARTDAALVA